MNLFNKKEDNKIGWDTLPIKYLKEINKISNNNDINEEDKILRCTALINNISYEELVNKSLDETTELVRGIKFLYNKPKVKRMSVRNLNLNGKEYTIFKDINEISTAQFIDFNSLMGDYENNIAELLSIFIIPKGHKYNTDYDIKEVVNDINNYLTIEEGISLANFFITKYKKYVNRSLLYLEISLKMLMMKKGMNKEMKEMIKEKIKQMEEIKQRISFLVG